MLSVSHSQTADRSHLRNLDTWPISYSIDANGIHRHVRLRSGGIVTSAVQRNAESGNLQNDFDLSWLRSTTKPLPTSASRKLRVADLFAGCGGMSLGFAEATRAMGAACEFEFASEMDPIKASVFERNLNPTQMHAGDIEGLVDGSVGAPVTASERALLQSLSSIDVLLGGPPCQGHSDLNNHTRRNDVRNTLIDRMVRFAELTQPELVIIENVEGVRHDQRRSAARAAEDLRNLEYYVEELQVHCLALGVPQARRRYMLVASKWDAGDALREFALLDMAPRTVGWGIEDLLTIKSTDTFDTPAVHSEVNARRIRYLFENDVDNLPNSERPDCHRLKNHSYNGVYGRMDWNKPAPTITTGFGSTGQGRFVHPKEPRTLTPHEAARLQTYPDFFDFGNNGRTQLQKMIGNSVPPIAMTALATALLR